MSRYFDRDGVYDSKISDYLDTSTVVKRLNEADITIEAKQARIQEINDRYEELLVEKCNEYELTQAKEDVKMLEERNLCLFSLLYELLEKQGYKDVDSVIEQMTNMHHNKCSHWYKNNKSCDILMKELVRLKKNWKNSKLQQQRLYNKLKQQHIAELEEQLKNAIVPKFKIGDKVYAIIDTFAYTDVFPVQIRDNHLLYEVWDGQDITKQHYTRIFASKEEAQAKLEELKKESTNDTRKNSAK